MSLTDLDMNFSLFGYDLDMMNSSDLDYGYNGSTCCSAPPCSSSPTQAFAGSFLPPFYILIFLLGLWGNAMVIAVLLRAKEALPGTDVFIFNLALADVLLVVTLPFWAAQEVHGWIFGNFLCKLVGSIFKINFYASIFFLVCISIDRFLAIVHVIRMYNRNKTSLIVFISLAVWALCFLLALPDFIFLMAEFDSRQNTTSCSLSFPVGSAKAWKIGLNFKNLVLAFLLPLVIMSYCYTHIILTLLLSKGFQKHKALRVILAVVAAFFLCWSPYHLVHFINTLIELGVLERDCELEEKVDIAGMITTNLGFFHCCLNPLLYAFVSIKFQNRFLELLGHLGCVSHKFLKRYTRGSTHRKDSTWSGSTEASYAGI
ncbi:C-X-C chemokine receptor type 3-like [Elgaria multicarinata webbii]|uniref:C-X-C chemokine receptor type 3-like n=1 Tax=Elgaria multicarinata webbii TaxID=159646 RepID=UPI002FCCF6FC